MKNIPKKQGVKKWAELFQELWKRSFQPFGHPSFVFFFLVAIVIIGGSSIWIDCINYLKVNSNDSLFRLNKSIAAFYPVLGATTCLQAIWAGKQKVFNSFVIFLFFCTLFCLYLINEDNYQIQSLKINSIATFITIWIWWMINGENDDLKDGIDVDAPVGGTPGGTIPGSLNEFKTE